MVRQPAAVWLLVLLVGCRDERATSDVPTTARNRPATIVRRLEMDITTFNPVLGGNPSEVTLARYLFSPLVFLDRTLKPIPGLATWTISADHRRYRFSLKKTATFSDGTPVRAGDVVFTLQKIRERSSEALHLVSSFQHLESAVAVNDHTVDVVFQRPLASQLARFADVYIVPEHVYGHGDFRAAFDARVVGSGPYTLVRRSTGRDITVRRRPDYWGEPGGAETVIFKVIGDHGTAWRVMNQGLLDETIMEAETWQVQRGNPQLANTITFRTFYPLQYNFIAWNGQHSIFRDARVRRALGMCVPTQSIIDRLYHGTARPISGPFMPGEDAYNAAVAPLPHAPSDAARLLDASGWRDHDGDGVRDKGGRRFAFVLDVMPDQPSQDFAQLISEAWKRIGVDVELRTMEPNTDLARVAAGEYVAAYLAWGLDAEPDLYSKFHSSQVPPHGVNFVFYKNPDADRLIEAARMEFDPTKRAHLHRRLHAMLAADQPYTWVMQVAMKWAGHNRLQGVAFAKDAGPFGWYPGELAWRVAPTP